MVKNTNYALVAGGNVVKIPKKGYQNCLKARKVNYKFLYGSIISLVAIVIIFFIGIPYWMRHMIQSQIQLRKGSIAWDLWSNIPVPIFIKCWQFNITNPNAIQKGEKFKLEEFGPYVFEEKRTRTIMDVNEDEDTVTFNETVFYHFRPDLSNGSLDDSFTIPNILYLSVASIASDLLPGVPTMGIMRMLEAMGETYTWTNVKPRDFFMEGMKVNSFYKPLVNIGPGNDVTEVANNKFAYLLSLNGSQTGQFKVKAGVKDPSSFGKIVSWNGQTELDYWTDPSVPADQQYCNKINGSDGTANLPLVTEERKVYIFHPYLCRSIYFRYKNTAQVHGIKTYALELPNANFESPDKNPENLCFCRKTNESLKERCIDGGFYLGAGCKKDSRIVITRPHFLEGEKRFLDSVEGLNPSKEKHDTVAYMEPLTGVPVKASVKLQANIEIKRIPGLPSFDHLNYTMLPMMWLEVTVDLREKDIQLMKTMFVNKEVILVSVKWVAIGLNVVLLILAIVMVIRRRMAVSEE